MASACVIALLSAGMTAPAAQAEQARQTAFAIAAQPLDEALIEFARVSGAQVLYSPDLVRGRSANAVDGILPPADALRRILEGSGVIIADHEQGSFTLRAAPAPASTPVRTQPPQPAPPRRSTVPEPDQATMDTVVVIGERLILERSLDLKRNAEYLSEVVTSDGIAALPDDTPAEALRRMPGLFSLDDQGEGRYAGIRGIDPELMNITFNGQPIGAPEGGGSGGNSGRAVRMDSIPSDLIGTIEVVKAVTPDMDHNAIGGGINITTASPFLRKGTFHSGNAQVGYNDASGNTLWSGSATLGTKLGSDERWGLLMSGSFSQRTIGSHRMSTDGWQNVNGAFLPSTRDLFDYNVDRRRWGVTMALEHRPNDNHSIRLNANFNSHRDDEERQKTAYNFARNTLSEQTEDGGRFAGGQITREFRWYLQEDTIYAASLTGEHKLDDRSTLDWSAGYSSAEKATPRRVDWEFRTTGNRFPNTYDTSGRLIVVTPNNIEAYLDPDNYPFRRVRRRTDTEREEIFSGRLNFRQDIELAGHPSYWKTGASYLRRDKLQDRENENYLPAQAFTLGDFDFAGPDIDGYFDGRYIYGPRLNIQNLERFLNDRPEYFVYNDENSILDSTGGDYDGREEITSAYGLLSINMGKLNVLGGVRIEHTQGKYSANETFFEAGSFTGDIRTISGGESYTDFFPSLHLRWEPAEDLLLRASWTNTIGRQPFMDLRPVRSFNVFQNEESGGLVGSVSEGNPNLKPYRSTNYDLSLEYYPASGGIMSAALFHKKIENAVFQRSFEDLNVDFEGFFFEQLNFSRPENADAGSITGLELNYQRFFDFLPAPFDGLGASVNYTYADSSLEVFSRPGETLNYIRQPNHIGNVAAMYEKGPLSARIAVSYTGDFLTSIGRNDDLDRYRARRAPLDARISYQMNSRLNFFVNARNLNNASESAFSGQRDRLTAEEIYSWTGWAGVKWRL